LLVEALLTSCNSIEDPAEHARLVGDMLQPYAQRLVQGELAQVRTRYDEPFFVCVLPYPARLFACRLPVRLRARLCRCNFS